MALGHYREHFLFVPGTRENLKKDSSGRHGGASVRSGDAAQPRQWSPAVVDQPTRISSFLELLWMYYKGCSTGLAQLLRFLIK